MVRIHFPPAASHMRTCSPDGRCGSRSTAHDAERDRVVDFIDLCDALYGRIFVPLFVAQGLRGWLQGVVKPMMFSDFNDGRNDFAELRALIVQARATAMNDADPCPAPRPRLDIERA
jgi:hypothetical protein